MRHSKRTDTKKIPAAVNYRSGWILSLKMFHFFENKELNNKRSEIFKELQSSI